MGLLFVFEVKIFEIFRLYVFVGLLQSLPEKSFPKN